VTYAPSDDRLREILDHARTIAVVGLSSNPMRDSFGVAQFLQVRGYRIVPVNPNETEVVGEKAYPTLMDLPDPVDLVDVFRRPTATPEVAWICASGPWWPGSSWRRPPAATTRRDA
jgi:predicted CoA-binding protein